MLTGQSIIAGTPAGGGHPFRAIDPSTGASLEPEYAGAGEGEVALACAAAEGAFDTFAHAAPEVRARLLEVIADEIMALGDPLLERAAAESGLPAARLTGERGRTVGQLRLFAAEVREGGWQGVRIDPAIPDRQPMPRSDLRLRTIAIGPAAVFGASNFPLAFSVAGGDTASALAAGCPVVVKGHPAQPGTSELVGQAITRAVDACGLPAGVFSLLLGTGNALGSALVADPRIAGVGFTGSRSGGLALMKIAAARPVPIPVYAEMSSINPVVLFPGALAARAEALGAAFVASLTLGSGQFCTNPGLVLAIEGPNLDRFLDAAAAATVAAGPATMLTPDIHAAYEAGVARLGALPDVMALARADSTGGPHSGRAALFAMPARAFIARAEASQEVFGAASLVVRCADADELRAVIAHVEGQLTATLHFDAVDEPVVATMIPALERIAGRLIANGWPTGVEVSHAMVHGGPYPATSDGRTTSVGTLAIERWLRPVCYQDFPDALLPPVLREGGQAGIAHRFDGARRG
ncbi:aldehyde dehydrogenase (NADP(+)) [Sphingomonas sp.]|jgi:NADP-dependent aldehyde dehydrogenase|uniref:aldehyde dehydrogenase (NADP(+)) n=1 Tax=Sphingomonas sp. TaxID=28214 RepID=UPI002D7E764B|nr:aldehyde dehydrogenase (NADP(+)) [Sphingomonas sp.]HEU0045900.1 aldehyde dehydrogenase (NADP(+)) [Sphingomonas sp.]